MNGQQEVTRAGISGEIRLVKELSCFCLGCDKINEEKKMSRQVGERKTRGPTRMAPVHSSFITLRVKADGKVGLV